MPILQNNILNEKSPIVETEKDTYIRKLFAHMSKILAIFETLNTIPKYLSLLPPKEFFEKNKLEKSQYYQYHLENHVIRTTSVFDILLLLTNDLYELGIDPKKCSPDMIFTNQHTKSTNEVKYLKELKKGITNVQNIRNKIVHRGEFQDKDINDLSVRETVLRHTNIDEVEDLEVKRYLRDEKFLTKYYKTKYISQLKKTNEGFTEFTNLFLNVVHKTYMKRVKVKK